MIQGRCARRAPARDKQVHFMELCDQFHIPIVYFVDCPGFLVGPDAERSGALRRGHARVLDHLQYHSAAGCRSSCGAVTAWAA
jgi:acetyl-CoA carboxylase carboxyltransferase component